MSVLFGELRQVDYGTRLSSLFTLVYLIIPCSTLFISLSLSCQVDVAVRVAVRSNDAEAFLSCRGRLFER